MQFHKKPIDKKEIASLDVDSQNGFTPLCMGELPVEGGHLIVPELNAQAQYAGFRLGSKDAHSMASLWIDTDKHPQLEPIAGYTNMDVRWRPHCIPGTFGFKAIEGLPHFTEYDYFAWKGIELDTHPYGACYHDLECKMSTGVIEYLHSKKVKVVIVGGLATDFCVKDTVLQLLKAGFKVILNLGACRHISEATLAPALEIMKERGAIMVNGSGEIPETIENL